MPSLFISYRRADSPSTVKLIYEQLRQQLPRWQIFFDHQSIRPGEPFPERLRDEVTAATVVLVVIGPSWLRILQDRQNAPADFVRDEIRLALETCKHMVPVPVDNADMPGDADLADFADIRPLWKNHKQPIRPEPDFDSDLQKLIAYLKPLDKGVDQNTVLNGRYRVMKKIGDGGMGVVWKAEQTVPVKQIVAVKVIKPGMEGAKEILARFDAEKQALAKMDHPNIARVLDAGQADDGQPFFVMEYLEEAVPITKYCDHKKLTLRERLKLFIPVCNAVQHAHQKMIVHRDISPSNVLVKVIDGRPVPMVIDFGLAKALGRQNLTDKTMPSTALNAPVGTLEYSAPEQAAGRSSDVDATSDIYSLGALLYELLTGAPPFARAEFLKTGEDEMRRVIREVEPAKPSKKLSNSRNLIAISANRDLEPKKLTRLIIGDLDWIVMKCLEKEQARRYETANQLGDELQRFLAHEPVLAGPPSVRYRASKFLRRNKGAVIAAGLVFLTLVAGTLGTGIGFLREARQRQLAQEKGENERLAKIEAQSAAAAAKLATDKAVAATDKVAETLGHVTNMLAQSRWNEGDVAAARDLLYEVEPRFRSGGWRFLRRHFEGSLFTLYGHTGKVNCVCFSPDGQLLASASDDNTVKIWDANTGQDLYTLTGHADVVTSISFRPDGKLLASASHDKTVKLWDGRTGTFLKTLKEQTEVTSACFSPDGRLASATKGGVVTIWSDGRLASATKGGVVTIWSNKSPLKLVGNAGALTSVCFSPDGKDLYAANSENLIIHWDAQTGKERGPRRSHHKVTSVCFSPDGRHLGSASKHKTVMIWDMPSEIIPPGFEPPPVPPVITAFGDGLYEVNKEVTKMCFSPDAQRVAWASADGTACVMPCQSDKRDVLRGHTAEVTSVCFSPDAQRLATASADRTVMVWDVRSPFAGQRALAIKRHSTGVMSVRFSPDGDHLVSASADGAVRDWNLRNGLEKPAVRVGAKNSIGPVCLSPDGLRLASSDYKTVTVWDRSGKKLQVNEHDGVTNLCFSPDGQLLASADLDETVKVWENGKELAALKGHKDAVKSVCFSPNGKLLASASKDETVKVWGALSGEELLTLEGHIGGVESICFSPDGAALASASSDTTVKIWDVRNGTNLLTLKGHTDKVTSVCFSPDGQLLASATERGMVNLWDARSGQELLFFKGHGDVDGFFSPQVYSLCFSPDGQLLASASNDKTVKLWDARRSQEPPALKTGPVYSVCFSPDGQRLASASQDGMVRLWNNQGQQLLALKGLSPLIPPAPPPVGALDLPVAPLQPDQLFARKLRAVYFSPDGKSIINAVYGEMKIWDARTGEEMPRTGNERLPSKNSHGAIDPVGKRLALPVGGYVEIIDLAPPPPAELMVRRMATSFQADWHQAQADESMKAGDSFAADFHLRKLGLFWNRIAYLTYKQHNYAGALDVQEQAVNVFEKAAKVASGRKIAFSEDVADCYLSLGWYYLWNQRPADAVAASENGMKYSNKLDLFINQAHGHLFQGQWGAAAEIYRQYRFSKIGDKTFADIVRQDLKEFREGGLTHPDFEKVEQIMREP